MPRYKLFPLLLIVALLSACQAGPPQRLDAADYPADQPIRVALVGDSITYGYGIEDRRENSYPAVLQEMLGERFEVENFGVNGNTLLREGDKPYWDHIGQVDNFYPNAVVVMLGTNDTKPANWEHAERFDDDLRAMIEHFRGLSTDPKVWIALPPAVHESNWGINERTIEEQQGIIRRVAGEMNVPVIDAHAPFVGRGGLYQEDGVHPNARGARVLARTVRRALRG